MGPPNLFRRPEWGGPGRKVSAVKFKLKSQRAPDKLVKGLFYSRSKLNDRRDRRDQRGTKSKRYEKIQDPDGSFRWAGEDSRLVFKTKTKPLVKKARKLFVGCTTRPQKREQRDDHNLDGRRVR